MENNIKKILSDHEDDESQLQVLKSLEKNIMIEAPAGYGKTKTLISKIKIMLIKHEIPKYKKILCLTFSVNAAYKIKKDIQKSFANSDFSPEDHLVIGNFHSLSRSILRKYGYLRIEELRDINELKNCSSQELLHDSELNESEKKVISEMISCIHDGYLPTNFSKDLLSKYNSIVEKLIKRRKTITYDAILTFTIELLINHTSIKEFYTNYFNTIIIDEFQDTNILSWTLTKLLFTEQTRKIFLGDSLQRIYGFIGAIPNLIDLAVEEYSMKYIPLMTNHRFANNINLLRLEKNIRENANNPQQPHITDNSKINFSYLDTQKEEAIEISKIVQCITNNSSTAKIAILVKQRGANIDVIKTYLEKHEISYFDGLFTDDDVNYIEFHSICLDHFYINYEQDRVFLKKDIKGFCNEIFNLYSGNNSRSFIILLQAALIDITSERNYFFRNELIIDLFLNNGLKNYLDKIDSQITITTVHSSKGLEWDYVILPDMEQGLFPNYLGLCQRNNCLHKRNCNLKISDSNEESFIEEISIFYVAITRAKKDIFFTASKSQIYYSKYKKVNLSCLLQLPGIIW